MGPDYIERIKQLKNDRKMTNEALSQVSGIPLGTLSKLLAGFSDSVKLSNIVALCDALDCSVDYIVSGVPENTNNYTLDGAEIRMIEDYRRLDDYGRELVSLVIGKERERVNHEEYVHSSPAASAIRKENVIITPAHRYGDSGAKRSGKRQITLYDLPVSAGVGEYLDGEGAGKITLPASLTGPAAGADFALRISGNSMEPKYHNGDILLVEDTDAVEVGDPCVYILDGNGYFKIFGGDCLISLNPEYGRIMLKDFEQVNCAGRVLGRLKKR
ncbi:MAG: helix-turn-helix domain-containing protein [Clostridia bacterium]|nr:helix-turn-helix domain-containing protein [Clostridia bacterium]